MTGTEASSKNKSGNVLGKEGFVRDDGTNDSLTQVSPRQKEVYSSAYRHSIVVKRSINTVFLLDFRRLGRAKPGRLGWPVLKLEGQGQWEDTAAGMRGGFVSSR